MRERSKPRERDERPQVPRIEAPEIPEEIVPHMLPREMYARLRTLSKANAEDVARHLVMALALIGTDAELAYTHAQVALARGGRVDSVREVAALTAHATERYAEALREFRTVKRLSGSTEHIALMADCERGLGRPERALDLAREYANSDLSHETAIELAIVTAGARVDRGEYEAAIASLAALRTPVEELGARISAALAHAHRAAGNEDEAVRIEATIPVEEPTENPVVVADEDIIVVDTEAETSDSHEDSSETATAPKDSTGDASAEVSPPDTTMENSP